MSKSDDYESYLVDILSLFPELDGTFPTLEDDVVDLDKCLFDVEDNSVWEELTMKL